MSTEGSFATLDQALSIIQGKALDAKTSAVDGLLPLDQIDDFLDTAVKNLRPSSAVVNQQVAADSAIHHTMMTPPKKKRRSPASNSTAVHRRKNAEILFLRERAEKLEDLLAQLKGNELGGSLVNHSALAFTCLPKEDQRSKWHSEAVTRYHERNNAEKTNRRLKEILQEYNNTSQKVQTILKGRKLRYGMEYLRNGETPCILDALQDVDYSYSLKARLEAEIETFYRGFYDVYQPHDPSMIYCAVQPKYDEKHKSTYMEFVTTTPMERSMEDMHKLTWEYLENTSDPTWKSNTLEKKVNVTLCHTKGTYNFKKLHLLRKFEEEDRIIIIWADVYLLPSKKLQARSLAYAVIERSRTNPTCACVKHTMLKLQVECTSESGGQATEEMKQNESIVLGAMARGMRQYWRYEQNRLVEENLRQPPTRIKTEVHQLESSRQNNKAS
ncbi:hypothetical protein PHYBOEH_007760 [Phytophthora boehmeriae]|uniref:M96 mating-specific protein family n=1 Tax=Phytophthora boehmeriae TaxID=109152 RepID=A0A8T1W5A4_9STRA|nr:hypothetical protein PHYBOEH_007760 [Phytophthora boehmeriae]